MRADEMTLVPVLSFIAESKALVAFGPKQPELQS
jgi:hypothetical protein